MGVPRGYRPECARGWECEVYGHPPPCELARGSKARKATARWDRPGSSGLLKAVGLLAALMVDYQESDAVHRDAPVAGLEDREVGQDPNAGLHVGGGLGAEAEAEAGGEQFSVPKAILGVRDELLQSPHPERVGLLEAMERRGEVTKDEVKAELDRLLAEFPFPAGPVTPSEYGGGDATMEDEGKSGPEEEGKVPAPTEHASALEAGPPAAAAAAAAGDDDNSVEQGASAAAAPAAVPAEVPAGMTRSVAATSGSGGTGSHDSTLTLWVCPKQSTAGEEQLDVFGFPRSWSREAASRLVKQGEAETEGGGLGASGPPAAAAAAADDRFRFLHLVSKPWFGAGAQEKGRAEEEEDKEKKEPKEPPAGLGLTHARRRIKQEEEASEDEEAGEDEDEGDDDEEEVEEEELVKHLQMTFHEWRPVAVTPDGWVTWSNNPKEKDRGLKFNHHHHSRKVSRVVVVKFRSP